MALRVGLKLASGGIERRVQAQAGEDVCDDAVIRQRVIDSAGRKQWQMPRCGEKDRTASPVPNASWVRFSFARRSDVSANLPTSRGAFTMPHADSYGPSQMELAGDGVVIGWFALRSQILKPNGRPAEG